MKNSKQSHIEQYLHYLAKPQEQLAGFAICPYLKRYMQNVMTVQTTDPITPMTSFAHLHRSLALEAVVITGFDWSFDKIVKQTEVYNTKYAKYDVEALCMHPDTEGSPLPLEYTYTRSPIIICQRTSILEKHRKELARTKYYTFYRDN